MKKLSLTLMAAAGLSLLINVAPASAKDMHRSPTHAHAETHHMAEDVTGSESPAQLQSGEARVHVNGLVCDFCARALEKVFMDEESVEKIDVNLDDKLVTVSFHEGHNLDDAT